MTYKERQALVERYRNDSSITYELTHEALNVLLEEVGEMEPIIDAINAKNGASHEERAKDIGCAASDFKTDWTGTSFTRDWWTVISNAITQFPRKQEKHMTLSERYELYLDSADDGNGNDITSGQPLKTFNEWLNS